MSNIRTNFEIAMSEAAKINEGSEKSYMLLAQSPNKEDSDRLFDMINTDLFKGEAPFKRFTFESFSKSNLSKVDAELKKNSKFATMLTQLGANVTGIGRGEIMMSYMITNCGIGGGGQDIDLTLYNEKGSVKDQAELKEAILGVDGRLGGWRTAAKHRPAVSKAVNDLTALYDGLKDVLPELDTNTTSGKSIQALVNRGEGAQFIKLVRDIHPVEVTQALSFNIQKLPEGELMITQVGGDLIGDLNSKATLENISKLVSSNNKIELKSFKTIEQELASGFGDVKEKFVFIQTIGGSKKYGGIHYIENLSADVDGTKFDAWSGGTIKVRVK